MEVPGKVLSVRVFSFGILSIYILYFTYYQQVKNYLVLIKTLLPFSMSIGKTDLSVVCVIFITRLKH